MAHPKKSAYKARPSMNVTPLVDVVLVLLIIFMVVIPALEQGVTIEVPGIRNVDEKTQGSPFMLSVSREGDFYFEDDRVPAGQLEARLKTARRREPSRRIVLRADKEVPYGDVRKVYKTVQSVEFPGVSLRVNHRQDETVASKL